MKILQTVLKCLRCGHSWVPRKTEVRMCPKCKSAWWDKPKVGVGLKLDIVDRSNS